MTAGQELYAEYRKCYTSQLDREAKPWKRLSEARKRVWGKLAGVVDSWECAIMSEAETVKADLRWTEKRVLTLESEVEQCRLGITRLKRRRRKPLLASISTQSIQTQSIQTPPLPTPQGVVPDAMKTMHLKYALLLERVLKLERTHPVSNAITEASALSRRELAYEPATVLMRDREARFQLAQVLDKATCR